MTEDMSRRFGFGCMRFLSENDKGVIYDAALEILARVGMVVHHNEAIRLLTGAGCRIEPGGRVHVPKDVVERMRESVPPVVRMHDRLGALVMELGGRNSYFGTGSDLLWTHDLRTGNRRRSILEDVAKAARLVDALPNMDFAMSSAYPSEVKPRQAYVLSFLAMLRNTEKPIVAVAENGRDLRVIRDLAAALRGGKEELRQKPYFAVYAEPASPLEHPADSIEKVLVCARAGVPCVYVPAPLTGATAPVTVAGYMAQGMAESLFGLVVHQLCRPGAPFVFGHGHAVLDMSTAQSSYNAVEGYAIEMGMVEMAKWLDLPNFANAGTTDSQLLDAQAGIDIATETLLVMQAGSNLNHNAGYLDFGLAGSLEGIVITDEVIALNRRLFSGIEVDHRTLALDVVAKVGPGGHFLGQRHTRYQYRRDHWRPHDLQPLKS
jgi:trimethylamine--corrinoid protein Co-methyltransferase